MNFHYMLYLHFCSRRKLRRYTLIMRFQRGSPSPYNSTFEFHLVTTNFTDFNSTFEWHLVTTNFTDGVKSTLAPAGKGLAFFPPKLRFKSTVIDEKNGQIWNKIIQYWRTSKKNCQYWKQFCQYWKQFCQYWKKFVSTEANRDSTV